MLTDDTGLPDAVSAWLAADPDPQTRAELEALWEAAEADADAAGELRRRFEGRLRFGTAGLRAPLGAGPARMNRVVVRQATSAVMATLPPGARVVVAHDARRNSDVFATDAAALVAAAGGEALLLGRVPTPVAAHAVIDRAAHAGVVITASHNPPADNGYKLYGADGVQIVSPGDAEVEAHMATAPLPTRRLPAPSGAGTVRHIGPEAIERYLAALSRRLQQPRRAATPGVAPTEGPHTPMLRVVYTPLHGVGAPVLLALFERLGLPTPTVVASQAAPDGEFPTVAFPNPEEPGALDAAYALAAEQGADLVLANDPDADRLAVAVATADGRRLLSGDEVGVLLADYLLHRRSSAAADEPVLLAASVVSSQMLRAMAGAAGVAYAETLTGFKWIARAADGRRERLLFGYEEALGYAVCDEVRDKDGMSAAALIVQLAADLRQQGSSLLERLDELHRRHGVHATGQVTVRFPLAGAATGPATATGRVRSNPPTEIAGRPVTSVVDYLMPTRQASPTPQSGNVGSDRSQAAVPLAVLTAPPPPSAGTQAPPGVLTSGPLPTGSALPATDMLVFGLGGGDRVIVRPSGTEPKLKVYVETVEQVIDGDVPAARRRAGHRRDMIAEEMRLLVAI